MDCLVWLTNLWNAIFVPPADSTRNDTVFDVIGNKTDAASLTAAVASLVALARKAALEAWEVEKHVHTYGYFSGIAAGHDNDPDTVSSDIDSTTAFVLTSGDDNPGTGSWVYGPWLCIFGNSDLPTKAGNITYDPHRVNIVDVSTKNVEMKIQFAYGATSGAATTAVANGECSSIPFAPIDLKTGDRIHDVPIVRAAIDQPLWARLAAKGLDAATVGFFMGHHEYPDPDV